MDITNANEWAETLKALAHPTRLQIIAELLKGTKCVTDIQDILPASQSNISQHLTVLRHANLVDFAQDGAQRCYYVSRPRLVSGIVTLLSDGEPVVRKSREDIHHGGTDASRSACCVK
jgi:DNA-binding transcriptional ArsR family regulator